VVSVVWITKGSPQGPFDLDGKPVPIITAYLFHAGGHENPAVLHASEGKSFIGSYVLGLGFTFDDEDDDGAANSISLMQQLVAKDPRNAERIFPYIGGEEVNDSPSHTHRRYVINFGDMPLRRADLGDCWSDASDKQRDQWLRSGIVPLDYPDAVAVDWPDLIKIVEEKVKPERLGQASIVNPDRWWKFARSAADLYAASKGLDRVMACPIISNKLSFTFLPANVVFSHKLCAFPFSRASAFAVLQSRCHEVWSRLLTSTMKDDLNYSPTDCCETFPFPRGFEASETLESAGGTFYEFRAALMMRNNEGLTKTNNRFHDPEERSPGILKLRDLHDAMDAAVLIAYGWADLIPKCACEFLLDYEDEEDDESEGKARKRKKPWRYRWPDEIRDEVLARLLKLNAERAKEEELAGQTAAAQKPKPKKAAAKAPKSGKAQLALGIATPDATERKLPADWRLPASQPLLYTTNLALTLLSEAGGSLAWPRLLDAFVLATTPKLMQRFAPAELSAQAKAWAARWNETVPDGLLIPSLNQLGAPNLTVTEGNDGPVFHLLDGPRPSLSEDVRYDAWLALRVAATLTPDAVPIPQRAKWTKEAKELILA